MAGVAAVTTWTLLPSLMCATPGSPGSPGSPGISAPSVMAALRPNIVYILADDLGYGDVQCLNPEGKIATPCIDRMAGQGMLFTDAHSGSALCTPTRYGILTGRYCWRTSLRGGVLARHGAPLIAAETPTVGGLLQQQGYRTACFGKWHLGWDWPKAAKEIDFTRPLANGPTTRGFDVYFGVDLPNSPPYCFIENDRTVGIPRERLPKHLIGKTLANSPGPALPNWRLEEVLPRIAQRAVDYIDARADDGQAFFLYLALTSPHEPVTPAAAWKGKSGIDPTADFIMQTDAVVGQVLEAVDRRGLAERTLVVFTSDNGHARYSGAEALAEHGHQPSGPWRGWKGDVFEGGHRVPFVARWPGKIKAGSRCDDPISLTDLMATAAELVGQRLPAGAGVDSVSIVGNLLGTARQPVREAIVHQSGYGALAIRQGKWKLAFCAGEGASRPRDLEAIRQGAPRVQLYDLSRDVGEKNNVAGEHPEVVQRLGALLEKYIAQGRSTPGEAQENDVAVSLYPAWYPMESVERP